MPSHDPLEECSLTAPVRALSIRQPHAELLVLGRKTVENRTWATSFRGWLYIHASLEADIRRVPARAREVYDILDAHDRRGALIGRVQVLDVVRSRKALIDTHGDHHLRWWKGPVGFVVDHAERFTNPIPCRGQQGLFSPPDAVMAIVRDTVGLR